MKNVNFAPVLVFPIRKCFFGPQDGLQNALRSPQDGSKRVLRSNFFRHRFCLRFWSTFGPVLVPSWPPFGRPKRPQNRSKNRSKIVLLQDGLQDRSKTAQEPPKTLPGLPRTPSRPPKTLPKRPPRASRAPLGPSKKSKTSKSSKTCRKKVDHGRLQWSLNTIARKNRKSVHNSRTPEGGGGGRAKRSSIRRPQRSTACCKSLVNISCFLVISRSLDRRYLSRYL